MQIERFFKQYVHNSKISAARASEYIFAFVSVGLARKIKDHEEILRIYNEWILTGKTMNVSYLEEHPILRAGSIELERLAKKIFLLLQLGESHRKIKSKMDILIKEHFPEIHNAVRMQDRDILKRYYESMELRKRKLEARFDAAVYFYFSVHDYEEKVDYQSLLFVVYDIEDYESKQTEYNKKRETQLLDKRRELIQVDAIGFKNKAIDAILKFHGIEASLLFHEENKPITETFLALDIESQSALERVNPRDNVQAILFHELLIKYQNMRESVLKSESIRIEVDTRQEYEKKISDLEAEKKELELDKKRLSEENQLIKEKINGMSILNMREVDQIKKQHLAEINDHLRTIRRYEREFQEYRNLQEVEDGSQEDHQLTSENRIELFRSFNKFTLVIIGGSKEWRRKLRERFPGIRLLNGCNENFDETILVRADLVFFFPKHMNHATYYKAMNLIKAHDIKYTYLEKTNMELVEIEIYSKIRQYEFEFGKIRVEI